VTGVTFPRVVRAEWTRLWTLRSTWITFGVAAVLTIGLGAAFGHAHHRQIQGGEVLPGAPGAVGAAFLGVDLPALVLGVLGLLRFTGEYASGSIRGSLAAVPRRWPVAAAKAVAVGGASGGVMLPACLLAFLGAQAMAGVDAVSLGDPGVARAILGAAAYPVATALIGLGLGAATRHVGLGVTGFVVLLLVVPTLILAAPQRIQDAVGPYLPVSAAQAMYSLEQSGPVHLGRVPRGRDRPVCHDAGQ
jgi:hypothetical protein